MLDVILIDVPETQFMHPANGSDMNRRSPTVRQWWEFASSVIEELPGDRTLAVDGATLLAELPPPEHRAPTTHSSVQLAVAPKKQHMKTFLKGRGWDQYKVFDYMRSPSAVVTGPPPHEAAREWLRGRRYDLVSGWLPRKILGVFAETLPDAIFLLPRQMAWMLRDYGYEAEGGPMDIRLPKKGPLRDGVTQDQEAEARRREREIRAVLGHTQKVAQYTRGEDHKKQARAEVVAQRERLRQSVQLRSAMHETAWKVVPAGCPMDFDVPRVPQPTVVRWIDQGNDARAEDLQWALEQRWGRLSEVDLLDLARHRQLFERVEQPAAPS